LNLFELTSGELRFLPSFVLYKPYNLFESLSDHGNKHGTDLPLVLKLIPHQLSEQTQDRVLSIVVDHVKTRWFHEIDQDYSNSFGVLATTFVVHNKLLRYWTVLDEGTQQRDAHEIHLL
jgi:hypothetical protein